MPVKQCPRCGITCDKYNAEAIDELFGFRMYKNAEYQQSQCKKCRSKKPLYLADAKQKILAKAESAYIEIRPLPELHEPIKQEHECRFTQYKNVRLCLGCGAEKSTNPVVELKPFPSPFPSPFPCQRDNQPLVKFPIDSAPSQLERELLQTIYIKTYPRDKEGPKRSYNFMWNKLHKRGLI